MDRSARLERIRDKASASGNEGFLFTDPANIFYLSGFRGSDGALFVGRDRAVLLLDGRYAEQAREEAPGFEVARYVQKAKGIGEALAGAGITRLGFEPKSATFDFLEKLRAELSGVELVPAGDWLDSLRAVKDGPELEILREAHAIADEAFREVMPLIRSAVRERDVATELEYRMKKKGAEKASFEILVASGKRAALPHAKPTDKALEEGEAVFVDFGCTFRGYQSDQTVTLFLGDPPPALRAAYEIVLEAHDRAVAGLKPGVSARALDAVARSFIEDRGYGESFTHGLGHGVGIQVHEYPLLSATSEASVAAGMVVTIEPGIYLPGKGGVRIEDTLAVSENGSERLTGLDKALRTL